MMGDLSDLLATPGDDLAVIQECAILRGGRRTHGVLAS